MAAGVPLFAHPATSIVAVVVLLTLSALFASWTWARRCVRPRSTPLLIVAIAGAQAATHVSYALAASLGEPAAAHAHHVHDPAASASNDAYMLAIHVVAILLGAAILTMLDRRVARAATRFLDRIWQAVASFRARPPRVSGRPFHRGIDRSALDAIARRARTDGRSTSRRGPPSPAFIN